MIDRPTLPTIQATRISLGWMMQRDIESIYRIFSDPEVMRYWSSPPLADREAAARLLTEIQDGFLHGTLFQWGIALNSDDTIIGTSTLFHLDESNRRVEIGYALSRAHWGHGYAGEALCALLSFAFGELNLNRIEADVDPRNLASIRTLERLGFQREGYLRDRWLVAGESQDSVFYGLLRKEWDTSAQGINRGVVNPRDGA